MGDEEVRVCPDHSDVVASVIPDGEEALVDYKRMEALMIGLLLQAMKERKQRLYVIRRIRRKT